jgi:hypothetical protein
VPQRAVHAVREHDERRGDLLPAGRPLHGEPHEPPRPAPPARCSRDAGRRRTATAVSPAAARGCAAAGARAQGGARRSRATRGSGLGRAHRRPRARATRSAPSPPRRRGRASAGRRVHSDRPRGSSPWRRASQTATSMPSWASRQARSSPTGPAPTIRTSWSSSVARSRGPQGLSSPGSRRNSSRAGTPRRTTHPAGATASSSLGV